MLGFLTVVMMLAVAYGYLVEGLFTACLMCCNVVGAGLVAFNFFEPVADQLEPLVEGTFLLGYEDAIALVALFAGTLALLRTVTNNLASTEIDYDETVQRVGGALFGLATGYLTAGFLVCMMQTLPWHENFMGFNPRYEVGQSALRRYLPPDRVWLAMMHRAGLYAFSNSDDQSFDQAGDFELRYARHRRHTETREPATYNGEFERQLQR
jgi:hypothetical protein